MWSQIVTWGLSSLWVGMIAWCWSRARRHARSLQQHESVLMASYKAEPDTPYDDPLTFLQAEGWRASPALTRLDIISRWRAVAQAHKQKLVAYIEMMPQLGLLGTVVSLFLAAFLFDFNMETLGFALFTTICGLVGALWSRSTLEIPSEENYFNILELLENPDVIQHLLNTPRIES